MPSFTALIPLRICSVVPPALSATIEEVESIRRTLRSSPKPMIVAISQSSSTRALLSNYLHGLNLNLLDNAGNLVKAMTLLLGDVSTPKTPKKDIPSLQEHTMVSPILVIIDGSTDVFNEVATALDNLDSSRRMHMIQILPRSATTMHRSSSAPTGTSDLPSSRVIRCSKPIRELSLLRAVAEACNPRSDLHLELPVPQDTLPSPGSSRTPKPKSSALPSPVFAPPKVSSFFTDHQLESFKKTHILIAEGQYITSVAFHSIKFLLRQPCGPKATYVSYLRLLGLASYLSLVSRQLTNLGFVVTASSNGLEAVESKEVPLLPVSITQPTRRMVRAGCRTLQSCIVSWINLCERCSLMIAPGSTTICHCLMVSVQRGAYESWRRRKESRCVCLNTDGVAG